MIFFSLFISIVPNIQRMKFHVPANSTFLKILIKVFEYSFLPNGMYGQSLRVRLRIKNITKFNFQLTNW